MENSIKDFKTGTTTVGLITADKVILAADMRASFGHIAYDEESQKLYKITDKIAVTNHFRLCVYSICGKVPESDSQEYYIASQ